MRLALLAMVVFFDARANPPVGGFQPGEYRYPVTADVSGTYGMWCDDLDDHLPLTLACQLYDGVYGQPGTVLLSDTPMGTSATDPVNVTCRYTVPAPVEGRLYDRVFRCQDSQGFILAFRHPIWLDFTKPVALTVSGPVDTFDLDATLSITCRDNAFTFPLPQSWPAASRPKCVLSYALYDDVSGDPAEWTPSAATTEVTDDHTPLTLAFTVGGVGRYRLDFSLADSAGFRTEWTSWTWQVGGYDFDLDGLPDTIDVCPAVFDPDQADADEDGKGDACDPCFGAVDSDADQDGTCDDLDACPLDPGDDSDDDTVCDGVDACPGHPDIEDADADTIPDGCDLCTGRDTTGDGDHDGWCARDTDFAVLDCDDDDDTIHPGAVDVPDNGTDEDCDGTDATEGDTDTDADSDSDSDTDTDADADADADTDTDTDSDSDSDSEDGDDTAVDTSEGDPSAVRRCGCDTPGDTRWWALPLVLVLGVRTRARRSRPAATLPGPSDPGDRAD